MTKSTTRSFLPLMIVSLMVLATLLPAGRVDASTSTTRANFQIPVRLCPDPTSQLCVWAYASTSGTVTLSFSASGSSVLIYQDQSIAQTNHATDWFLFPTSWVEHKRSSTVLRSTGSGCYVWLPSGSASHCFTTPVFSESWLLPVNPAHRISGKHTIGSYMCCTYVLPSSTPAVFQVFP